MDYTKNPWKLLSNSQELYNIQTGESKFLPKYQIVADDRVVCNTSNFATKQDAQLIAAAPQMLEALISVSELLGSKEKLTMAELDMMLTVGNLIKKAKGL